MKKKNYFMFSLLAMGLVMAGCDNETSNVGTDAVTQSVNPTTEDVAGLVADFQNQVNPQAKTRSNSLVIDAYDTKIYTVSTGQAALSRSTTDIPDSTQVDMHYIKFHQDTISGFAVVSNDPRLNRVYAFVEDGDLKDTATVEPLKWAIEKIPGIAAEDIQMYYEQPQSRAATTSVLIGPIVKTEWHQDAPFNNYAPVCESRPDGHCPIGCVPVAAAQLIAHCQRFKGTYYGNKDIDFKTLTSVSTISTTSNLARQAATFVHEVAMYCQVDFGCEGSSSHIKDAFQYLKELGYTGYYTEGGLDMNALYRDLKNDIPHISQGSTGSSGHAWIVDGIKGNYNGSSFTQFTVHCNWGWGHGYNGWFSDYRQPSNHEAYSKNNRQVYITQY